jgi:hypothetical protein
VAAIRPLIHAAQDGRHRRHAGCVGCAAIAHAEALLERIDQEEGM